MKNGDGSTTGNAIDGSPAGADAQPPSARGDDTIHSRLLDGMRDAVVVLDHDGGVCYANAAARRLLPIIIGASARTGGPLGAALYGISSIFEIDHDTRRLHGQRMAMGELLVWTICDVTGDRARSDALLAERSRSAFLAETSQRLGASLHRDRTARTTVSLVVPALADCAVVVLTDGSDQFRWYRVSDDNQQVATGALTLDQLGRHSAVGQALDGVSIADDPRLDADVRFLLPSGFEEVGCAVVLPLPGHGATIGAILLVRGLSRPAFDTSERHMIRQFATRAGSAVAAATLYGDLGATSTILQRSLEPAALPTVPGVMLGAAFRPARERLRIGGDFYGVFAGPDGRWTFMLGDVCGKGVAAAVQTGKTRQSLYALRLLEADPARLLDLLNQAVMRSDDPQLTTILLGSLQVTDDGGVTAVVASGGHPPPLVIRHGGDVEVVDVRGMSIGLINGAHFGRATVLLQPGDTLVAYTDGVTEARGGPDGDFFGDERLMAALSSYSANPAAVVSEHVEQLVAEWIGEHQHDDIAVLAIQPAVLPNEAG